jgi:type I restriction enzyme M protein
MRNAEGLQPQEAFDELLKYLFFKQVHEETGPPLPGVIDAAHETAAAIRVLFATYLNSVNTWATHLWRDRTIGLADRTLTRLHDLFCDVSFATIGIDVRSEALKEFLPPEIRRGLGIYLTPDDVVRMMVRFVRPEPTHRVYDPACGSGTFLIEVARSWARERELPKEAHPAPFSLWGSDVNPRMLLLSELNLGHLAGLNFRRELTDALASSEHRKGVASEGFFDLVLTNPPFGVVVDGATHDLRAYATCRRGADLVGRQQSEVLFIEACLRFVRPGGMVGIVLPKSVITNHTLADARAAIDAVGHLVAVVILPPETFRTTGTQTTTVVLFFRKYEPTDDLTREIAIPVARIDNVGFDQTGRPREGNQLLAAADDLRATAETRVPMGLCGILEKVKLGETLSVLHRRLTDAGKSSTPTRRLGDLVEVVRTGATPPRASYTDVGLFVVKVGNLSGGGLDWTPRDRNFVSEREADRRRAKGLILRRDDILLTSSAHSPVYIAKKVDILTRIPEWAGGEASFVGEVMLVRANRQLIDPYALLAFLRAEYTLSAIQRMVRGQTAHLHPDDLLELPVPESVFGLDDKLAVLLETLREEARLVEKINDVLHAERQQLVAIFGGKATPSLRQLKLFT